MKIVLPGLIKSLIGALCGSATRDAVTTFLESDLKAAWDALAAIPGAIKTGNVALVESYIGAFIAHLPKPIADALVAFVVKKFGSAVTSVASATGTN